MQRSLTFDSCWVQFHNIPQQHFVFGRIHTLDEVIAAERASGASKGEALATARETENDLEVGIMYGDAFDYMNPDGELGTTHKANAWPIDKSVYLAAEEAKGVVRDMPLWVRLSLSIALRGWQAHREDIQ